MQGRKDNESRLFYTVTLNPLVPADHPVRQIPELLDLSFLYEERILSTTAILNTISH